MIWTAKDRGPSGNGYGLPGHITVCDPAFWRLSVNTDLLSPATGGRAQSGYIEPGPDGRLKRNTPEGD